MWQLFLCKYALAKLSEYFATIAVQLIMVSGTMAEVKITLVYWPFANKIFALLTNSVFLAKSFFCGGMLIKYAVLL